MKWVCANFNRFNYDKKPNVRLLICRLEVIYTTHYDAVPNSAASEVLSAGLSSGVPCIFAVLTCEDMDQALNRTGGKSGNKSAEAALLLLLKWHRYANILYKLYKGSP